MVCETKRVGEYKPYPYDTEEDEWAEGYLGRTDVPRVLRGGSFGDLQDVVRCAFRNSLHPGFRDNSGGFRVIVVVPTLTSEL